MQDWVLRLGFEPKTIVKCGGRGLGIQALMMSDFKMGREYGNMGSQGSDTRYYILWEYRHSAENLSILHPSLGNLTTHIAIVGGPKWPEKSHYFLLITCYLSKNVKNIGNFRVRQVL